MKAREVRRARVMLKSVKDSSLRGIMLGYRSCHATRVLREFTIVAASRGVQKAIYVNLVLAVSPFEKWPRKD